MQRTIKRFWAGPRTYAALAELKGPKRETAPPCVSEGFCLCRRLYVCCEVKVCSLTGSEKKRLEGKEGGSRKWEKKECVLMETGFLNVSEPECDDAAMTNH